MWDLHADTNCILCTDVSPSPSSPLLSWASAAALIRSPNCLLLSPPLQGNILVFCVLEAGWAGDNHCHKEDVCILPNILRELGEAGRMCFLEFSR